MLPGMNAAALGPRARAGALAIPPAPPRELAWRAAAALPARAARSPDAPRKPATRLRGPTGSGAGPYRFTVEGRRGEMGEVRVRLDPGGILIHDLKVAPAYRGAGLGVALVRAALRFGASAGREVARLEADDDGSGRLLRWYHALGFKRAGWGPHGRPALEARVGPALGLSAAWRSATRPDPAPAIPRRRRSAR
jgi:GNAT superfamily N-acetyltransferase